jgi:hypothetical protein
LEKLIGDKYYLIKKFSKKKNYGIQLELLIPIFWIKKNLFIIDDNLTEQLYLELIGTIVTQNIYCVYYNIKRRNI